MEGTLPSGDHRVPPRKLTLHVENILSVDQKISSQFLAAAMALASSFCVNTGRGKARTPLNLSGRAREAPAGPCPARAPPSGGPGGCVSPSSRLDRPRPSGRSSGVPWPCLSSCKPRLNLRTLHSVSRTRPPAVHAPRQKSPVFPGHVLPGSIIPSSFFKTRLTGPLPTRLQGVPLQSRGPPRRTSIATVISATSTASLLPTRLEAPPRSPGPPPLSLYCVGVWVTLMLICGLGKV